MSAAPGVPALMSPADEFWEKCARHVNPQTCRQRVMFCICDDCADRLRQEALNNRLPIHISEPLQACCQMCNETKQIRQAQWFICFQCRPKIDGWAKTEVASRFVKKFWAEHIQNKLPQLILAETEPVRWESYKAKKRTQNAEDEAVEVLDFAVSQSDNRDDTLFHIEMKAGPGSIASMTEFQLDLGDSNAVARVCNRTKKVAYLFHVQIVQEQEGPTRRIVAKELWWTDCFTLNDNLKRAGARRDEDKIAGYYNCAAFKPKEEFSKELECENYTKLTQRLAESPLPTRPNITVPKVDKLFRMFKRLADDDKRSFIEKIKAAASELWGDSGEHQQ